jgi:putative ABC transport system substrate-binding protein
VNQVTYLDFGAWYGPEIPWERDPVSGTNCCMKRRDFITLLGVAAATWPIAARGQQAAMPVIGFLDVTVYGGPEMAEFRRGLSEAGFIEGKNVAIEIRSADGQYDRLPALASDLVRRGVAVITANSPVVALAAKAATATIPIVFNLGTDPVKDGLVASINRPGGNITGVTFFANLLSAKRLGLLHELLPKAAIIAVLSNPSNPNAESDLNDTQVAARALGLQLLVLRASTEREIDLAFANLVEQRAAALFVNSDAYLGSVSQKIAFLALRHGVPTSFSDRRHVDVGGLMSYGTNRLDSARQFGIYTGRILRGEKSADLPVMLPTKFELVINLRTAKALSVTIPNSMQLLADEVIE